jgi:hypothetical protein
MTYVVGKKPRLALVPSSATTGVKVSTYIRLDTSLWRTHLAVLGMTICERFRSSVVFRSLLSGVGGL